MPEKQPTTILKWWSILKPHTLPNPREMLSLEFIKGKELRRLSKKTRLMIKGELLDTLVRLDEIQYALDRFRELGIDMDRRTMELLQETRDEVRVTISQLGRLSASEVERRLEHIQNTRMEVGLSIHRCIQKMRERLRKGRAGEIRQFLDRWEFIPGYA